MTGVGILPASGVTELEFVEYWPVNAAFLAATLNIYAVPLVRPVTVTDVPVETPSENVVQFEPLSLEY